MRTTLSINQIIEEWMSETDASESTKADYRRKIALWFRYLSERGRDPRSAIRADIIDYKHHLQAAGRSEFTVCGYVTIVKLFYSFCEGRHYCDNIGLGIKSSFKMKKYYKLPLTSLQCTQLLDSIDTKNIVGKRDKLIVMLMLSNGLRTCEVQRVDLRDIGMQDGKNVLRIQRKGHTDKDDIVVLAPETMALLEDYLAVRESLEMEQPLFISHMRGGRGGERLLRSTISSMVKARLKSIGIEDDRISAHSLRHTCASLMIERGLDPQIVQDMLGHSNPSTTRLYTNMARQRRLFEHAPSEMIASMIGKSLKKRKE